MGRRTYPEPRKFIPKNPEKYRGTLPIISRSSYEWAVFSAIDKNPNIKSWSSESIVVPYMSPVDGKKHRYFPDLFIEAMGKNETIISEMIEIKPYSQTLPPSFGPRTSDTTRRKSTEDYAVNQAKWVAAKAFCDLKGYSFKILTENEIFGKKKHKV